MPAVCRFYLKGNCRYGKDCRFEHPGEEKSAGFSFTKALEETTTSNTSFSFTKALEETKPQFSPYPFANQQPLYSSTPYNFNSGHNQSIGFNNPYNQSSLFTATYQQQFNSTNALGNTFSFASADQSTLNFNAFNNTGSSTILPSQRVDEVDMRFGGEHQAQSSNVQLTELELKAYQSEKFQFRLIPVRPPPRELCF